MLSALEFKTAVFQRIDQPSYKLPIDERTLADADPLTILDSITCFPNKRRRRTRSRPSGETSSPWNEWRAKPAGVARDYELEIRSAEEGRMSG